MVNRFKHIIPIFLLALLLLPIVQSFHHTIEHGNEKYCHVLGEKHFHEQEHHCNLCDYTITAADTTSFICVITIGVFLSSHISSIFLSAYIGYDAFIVSSRGPPTV